MKMVLCTCLAFLLSSCITQEQKKIQNAVASQMKLYPESTLQDLYKSFFQAEFGAEHIVADTIRAGNYLNQELSIADNSDILFEPIGADSTFFRVHLCAVQKGFISRDELFNAFIGGVHKVEIPQIESWQKKWPIIANEIDRMSLNLPDYEKDKKMIEELLSSGHYAIHHSERFSIAYDPHYRIIRSDLFHSELESKLVF